MIALSLVAVSSAALDPRKESERQEREDRVDASLGRDPEGFGLGVILGLPTGLSAALRPKDSKWWFDAALAWSFLGSTLDTHADVLFRPYDARTEDLPDLSFPLYVGVGPRLHIGDDPTDATYSLYSVGARVPFGMGIIHDNFPLEGFLELVPGIEIAPETHWFFEAAVGARFYFGKKADGAPPAPAAPSGT